MPTILEILEEQRDKAEAAFEAYATPLIAENRSLTTEEDAKLEELRATRNDRIARIAKAEEDAAMVNEINERRKALGVSSPAVVRSEEHTYGPDKDTSFFADMCWAAMPGNRNFMGANERLQKHDKEMYRDAINDPAQRARVLRSGREFFREETGAAQRFANEIEARRLDPSVPELRQGMDTTSASGGSFVTPEYFVQDYAPYRTFGRVFADLCNKQDLPEYGMTIFLPSVNSPAGVGAQAGQNQGILETDPTAGYLSANLTTEAGQVTIAQQLLDRAGPNFQFDKMIFDQLNRAYNTTLDAAWITAALANAGAVTDTFTTGTTVTADLYSDIAQSISGIENAAGVVASPTHLFATPTQWAFNTAQVDANGRPLIVPNYAGPFNAIAAAMAGKGAQVPEGDTGYELMSLPVFKDGNIPASGSNTQIIVAHMPEVWAWEGPLIPRTIPQTYAQNLSVLLQVYSYNAVIVRYPKAVYAISGARYPSSPTWPQS